MTCLASDLKLSIYLQNFTVVFDSEKIVKTSIYDWFMRERLIGSWRKLYLIGQQLVGLSEENSISLVSERGRHLD